MRYTGKDVNLPMGDFDRICADFERHTEIYEIAGKKYKVSLREKDDADRTFEIYVELVQKELTDRFIRQSCKPK